MKNFLSHPLFCFYTLNQCIYRTMCYKVEDVIVKVLAKKHDQAAAKGTPDSVWFMKRA